MTAFTFDLATDPGETIVAASLTISLRAIGAGSEDDTILLDDTANPQTLSVTRLDACFHRPAPPCAPWR